MSKPDIVVIGASAGGVTALKHLVKGLPENFPGTIFIVLHIPPYTQTQLHLILSKAGPLEAVLAKDEEEFRPGMIYVAPNDHHLLLQKGKMLVKRGPRENRFRPSIDALFRSAAYEFGPRVVGIILSGILSDGASGLWTIKRHGGVAIIQDLEDAEQSQLPENVLEYVEPDYKLAAAEIGPLLGGIVKKQVDTERNKLTEEEMKRLQREVVIASNKKGFEMGIVNMGELTPFTCPECHGTLVRLVEDNIIRFRCHTGHAYTASSLLAEISESVEELLWQSARAAEEMLMLQKSLAEHLEKSGNDDIAKLFLKSSENTSKRVRIIQDCLVRQQEYNETVQLKQEA